MADHCRLWMQGTTQHQVVTVNPEIVMAAQRDDAFYKLLQTTENIPDGSGLEFAARYIGSPLQGRVTGVDLTEQLLTTVSGEKESVYLLGAAHGVAASVAQRFSKQNTALVIAGAESGHRWWHRLSDRQLVERIRRAKPRVLLVAFGAPKQEMWIAQNMHKLPSVKVAIGVGGSFDFLSGGVRRAPRFLRALRLEWLWRVSLQPWRWPRILVATWHFSRAVVRYRHQRIPS